MCDARCFFLFVCSSLVGCRCLLFVASVVFVGFVYTSLFVVRCLLFVVRRCLLHVASCSLCVVSCLLCVVGCFVRFVIVD